MLTVQEILKQSGFSDERIAALDAQAITAFGSVLTAAQQAEKSAQEAREAAELAQRTYEDRYKNEIAPALDKWGNDSARLKAEIAFYRTQAETAKEAGFIASDAPGFTPPPAGTPQRGANGEFVAGASGVPGSPGYMTQVEAIGALNNVNWTNNQYYRLYGTVPPDDFEVLLAEAGRAHMPYKEYVEKKYKFVDKRNEIEQGKIKEREDKVRADAIAERDKYWAERGGNNPNVRVGQESSFSELRKGIDAQQIKDPTTFKSKEERRAATSQLIQKEIANNMAGSVA